MKKCFTHEMKFHFHFHFCMKKCSYQRTRKSVCIVGILNSGESPKSEDNFTCSALSKLKSVMEQLSESLVLILKRPLFEFDWKSGNDFSRKSLNFYFI